MATGKKSFIAYSDWNEMFKELPDDIAGKLIKHIFAYVNDENPDTDDFMIKALFGQIKTTLKRDLEKWDKQREQRSEAGKKSAAKRKATSVKTRSTNEHEKTRNSTVNVNVNDNVNVLSKDNKSTYEEKLDFFTIELRKEEDYLKGMYKLHKLKDKRLGYLVKHFKNFCLTLPDQSKPKDLNHFRNFFTKWVKQQFDEGKYSHYTTKRLKGSL